MIQHREVIYRELLESVLKKNSQFTQLALSKKFKFSLSTVNNALRPLNELGIITKKLRGFEVIDARKLLLYWASIRKLSKDVIYSTSVNLPVMKIESSLPKGCIFTAFSAYRLLYKDAPADYSEVYIYANESIVEEIKKRFPQKQGQKNLIVLEQDKFLVGNITPSSQVYVDLWNIKDWYARDFLDALERRLDIW